VEPVQLRLDAAGMEAFCAELVRKSPEVSRAAAGLAAVQALVVRTVHPDQRDGEGHAAVLAVVAAHAEEARRRLIAEAARAIAAACAARDVAGLARRHRLLSRPGFRQAVESAVAGMDPARADAARRWVTAWIREAEARAAAAGGYPDAFDFDRAGIVPEDYHAMKALADALGHSRSA
jgi:hypothetical protein